MTFTRFLDRVIGEVETLGAATPSATDLIQLVVPGSDLDLYQAYAVCKKLNKNRNGTISQVVFSAMARPDRQSRQSPVPRLLQSVVKV